MKSRECRNSLRDQIPVLGLLGMVVLVAFSIIGSAMPVVASGPAYNINTLAGKVASVNGAPGLHIHISGFVEHEADVNDQPINPNPGSAITPTNVLSSLLDGTSVAAPDVTVNLDTAGAPQNEPVIAVDPNNPMRIVAGANDYVTRTWTCSAGSTPCSALGDGYSGTYYSNNGGTTWCCTSTDPAHPGTLIPGVERLTGGQYEAGGDPTLAFDSHGNVYFAGLGFDRTSPANTVTVSKGTFDGSGNLHWGPPTFIGQTTAPAIFNDKEWISVDSHSSSPFQDRVYVSWTRFIFNPVNGKYIQSPIAFAYSTDNGITFSTPQLIVNNVLYDQGSQIVVGSDGTVYVFWEGSTRLGAFNSIWLSKSTDGGVTWSKPVAISPLVDIISPANTGFRVNSFPAADIAPDGTLYAAWSSEVNNSASSYGIDPTCAFFYSGTGPVYANCHAGVAWSKSTDGGKTWTTPLLAFPALDASTRTAAGYPVTQPDGSTLSAPSSHRVETVFPALAVSSSGHVYMSAYAADVVSPWQTCAIPATPSAVGRIDCLALGNYIHNARLDYVVTDLTTAITKTMTTHPINTRNGFSGSFIGDYTDIAVGSDNVFHAIWTDTNNKQTVTWWYGFEFVPTSINQEDIVTASGSS